MTDLPDIWSYLSETPLLWLTATLVAYVAGDAAFRAAGRNPLVNPVLVAMVILSLVLWGTGTPYSTYFEGAQFVHFLLGPATVALAIPLHRQAGRLKGFVVPLLTAVVVGAVLSISSAVLLARALGADEVIAKTLGTKAATTPVAIALSEGIGGTPPLAAVFAIMIGIFTAVLGPATLNLLRIRDRRARGLAVGAVAHGIGASRMLREDETEGAVAGLSMGLTALAISLILPVLALWLF